MSMVCPQCNEAFAQALECPTCGVRLIYQPAAHSGGPAVLGQSDQWQYTPWGRVLVGLLIGQGIAHGLKMLLTAGWLAAAGASAPGFWSSVAGTATWHSLQCASLIVSTVLVSAGQPRGLFVGSLVGLVNGLIFLGIQHLAGEGMSELIVYGQPALHLTCGAFGGLIGNFVWRPLPALDLPSLRVDQSKAKRRATPDAAGILDGDIAWGRVLAGTVIVVCGIVWPKAILNSLVEIGQGKLFLQTDFQAQLISWEISALLTLVGAALAGATTTNGLKQGLCVGLLASVVMLGIQMGNDKFVLENTVFMSFSVLMLNMAGGWFGAELFPPVAPRRRFRASPY